MRNVLATLFLLFAIALATPNLVADFLLAEAAVQSNDTMAEEGLELVKRQDCDDRYNPCSGLGAPGLCCPDNTVCSADAAGNVACCPKNVMCTGTIQGVGGGATITGSQTQTVGSATSTASFISASTTQNIVSIGTATGTSFVQASGSSSYVRSTVSNQFYPFAFIPTTYTNAAACSSAYSSCQTDAASCTAALASGVAGVTVSAPNGGATVTAIASLGPSSASSICASLSSQACYGLQVEACQSFGGGGQNRGRRLCGNMYEVGAAVGMLGYALC